MDQKLYLSVDCGFDKFKCCIGDYLLAFSSKMIDVTNSINALSVADGDNTYIEYKGSVYMFGDSIDQIISMKSNLKMYAEELDSNRNKQRFKDRTFHISLLAAIGYSIVAYDTVYNPEKDVDKHLFRNLSNLQYFIGIGLPYGSMNEWPQIKEFLKQRHHFKIRRGSKSCTFDFDLDLSNANFLCNAQVITAFLFQGASSDGNLTIDKKALPCIMMDAGYKTVGLFELAKNLSINPETAFSDTDHAMYNIDKYVEEKVKDAGREDFSYLQVQYQIMASYIQININTANAPHFATWYHNRSGQAMSFLTAAVLNYAIKRQFLLIGYAPKDISLEELPKVFQIRIKGNESLVKWENDLKMASLNKRRTIEYILEQSISTDTPIRYTQAEMDMKIAELTFGLTAREEKSSVALSYVPVVNENPTDNSSNEAITKSTSSMKQDTSKVVSENKDTETASSRTTEENNSDNIFMNSAFAGLE